MNFQLVFLVLLVVASTRIENLSANRQRNSVPEVIFQWKQLAYDFPSEAAYKQAKDSGNLIIQNGIPIDVAPLYSFGYSRMFTTIPRFSKGIPYTLATVTARTTKDGDPILEPYPNYDWHKDNTNCEGIISAFRVAITECYQMWVIDSGVIAGEKKCPPQLLLFDLNTDQLIHRYRFADELYTPSASLFITPIVLVKDPSPQGYCRNMMIYVADVTQHGLVVYDVAKDTAWRIENRFMYPDPNYGNHTIARESFTLMDGIFGMSIDNKNLYFHPLASNSEYSVPLRLINDQNAWKGQTTGHAEKFKHLGDRFSQCASEAMDSQYNLYCVTFKPIKLISWNVNTPYEKKYLQSIAINPKELEFVSGMKVVRNLFGREELWMMSNRFQKIAAGTQNPNETNFRILKLPIDQMKYDNEPQLGFGTRVEVEPKRQLLNDLHERLIFT